MWKSIWKLSVISLFIGLMSLNTLAQSDTTIANLIENAVTWNEKSIILEGEVIGDIMNRGEHTWINIADKSGAIGVYIDTEEAKKINLSGNYKFIGDKVKVVGTFYRDLKDAGGEMAIMGRSLEVIESGEKIDHPIDTAKLVVLAVLGVVTLLLYVKRPKKVK